MSVVAVAVGSLGALPRHLVREGFGCEAAVMALHPGGAELRVGTATAPTAGVAAGRRLEADGARASMTSYLVYLVVTGAVKGQNTTEVPIVRALWRDHRGLYTRLWITVCE